MRPLLFACVVSLFAANAQAQPASPPAALAPTWGQEPLETLSSTRARVCLNGLWKFVPAIGADEQNPRDWGLISVPGSWSGKDQYAPLPGVQKVGNGPTWQGFTTQSWAAPYQTLARAWYERPLNIPANWAGRAISLDFARVSTDARVYVNNIECGRIAWPSGSVDITRAVTPGQTATLRVLVVASNDKDVETVFMGTAQGQIETRAAVLDSRGITNDVFLQSQPSGARVESVFVQPSTRKKSLTLDVDLENVAAPGQARFTVQCLDEKGAIEKSFATQTLTIRPGASTVRLTNAWANPRLWDFEQPNLYTLRLKVEGAGLTDDFAQPFGFREMWVQGRDFMLNGTKVRLRPVQYGATPINGNQIEVIDAGIDGMRAWGFNIQEQPEMSNGRGAIDFQDLFLERADRKGWPVIASLSPMSGIVEKWSDANGKPTPERLEWQRRVQGQLKLQRNHPSAVLWNQSINRWGGWDDQNPRRVGNNAALKEIEDATQSRIVPVGIEANEWIKSQDPTRNVATHQSGRVGDWHTNNSYLNFIPWQEQEEWLSQWAQTGDKPYMPVEFGYLLGTDFKRGKMPGAWGRGQGATYTEHLTTERLASIFGPIAYAQESQEQREINPKQFLPGAMVDVLGKPLGPQFKQQYYKDRPGFIADPLVETMIGQHYIQVYRAWRTMGTSGGMVPWEWKDSWKRNFKRVPTPPFKPGQRGAYNATVEAYKLYYLKPEGATLGTRTTDLLKSNSPTLAWICGAEEAGDIAAFTSKDHSFSSGERLQKRVALLNDTRQTQVYSVTWRVETGAQSGTTSTVGGRIEPAQTLFVPINAPLSTVTTKTDGKITLSARIGTATHRDEFAFRVFPPLAPAKQTVSIFDPEGKSTAMLWQLGYDVSPWNGGATPNLLVIGREALSKGHALPGNLETFVSNGGRVLVLEQSREWLRCRGFRVGYQVRREAWPVTPNHPVMAGLDAQDLRDWRGSSTLIEPFPLVPPTEKSPSGYPKHGWHWSNRGAISCAAIEKPHRSSWRPILEFDFDLAYTPLMEMEHGRGRITLCTLDLEDHTARDAGAAKLAFNLLNYARTAPLAPKATSVAYRGGDAGAVKLTALGVQFTRVPKVPTTIRTSDLIVFAAGDSPFQEDNLGVKRFVTNGGRALALPIDGPSPVKEVSAFNGSLNVPNWNVSRGLSASDLRWRAPHAARLVRGGTVALSEPLGGNIEAAADGLLGRLVVGKGEIVWTQFDPDRFDADNLTYFCFTRWRQTRALSQVLSNMGATFQADAAIFAPPSQDTPPIALSGAWKFAFTNNLPSAASMSAALADPGISDAAKAAVAPDFNDAALPDYSAPGEASDFTLSDGEAVLRRVVNVPQEWAGRDLKLSLGNIDDLDNTFWNGQQVGSVGAQTTAPYSVARSYTVPGRLVKAGRNVLAIRVFDLYGGGGLFGPADKMSVQPVDSFTDSGLYHPDYRTEYSTGDDPHRYYRW